MIKGLVILLIIFGLMFVFFKLTLLDSQHDVEEIMRRLKEEREELEEEHKCNCNHCHCDNESHGCCGRCHQDADGDR